MFTGIVEEIGTVAAIKHGSKSAELTFECQAVIKDVKLGDSICVNGICLTVTSLGSKEFTADAMPETMRRTNLGSLKKGDRVNLERALRLGDRLGGHIVSGHIDGTGEITAREEDDNAIWLTVAANLSILKYIVLKGSVALDGTSLTVAYVDESCFRVSLIPLTQGFTTLGSKKTGDRVNIECDVLGKYVEKLLLFGEECKNRPKKDLSIDFLRESGFA